jgi:hypothetical protein
MFGHIFAVLCEVFSVPMTDRGKPIACPPRSPDLNPLQCYLWRHLKILVYAAPVDNEEALHIVDACQTTRQLPRHLWTHATARDETCRGVHWISWRTFWYSFSYKSQIKCFLTHVDKDIFSSFGMWNSCPKFVRTFQLHSVYLHLLCVVAWQ